MCATSCNIFKLDPTSCNMLLQVDQTCATRCAQHCCEMLRAFGRALTSFASKRSYCNPGSLFHLRDPPSNSEGMRIKQLIDNLKSS